MKKLHFVTITVVTLMVSGSLHLGMAQTPPFNRTFVSAEIGLDSNSCLPTAPCRTFPRALTQTAADGEIVVLDSGGYGANMTIGQGVAIEIPEGVYAGMSVLAGTAINIDTSAAVRIRGLTLNSVAAHRGFDIVNAAAIYLEDMTVKGFDEEALLLRDDSIMTIVDSTFSSNNTGIVIAAGSGTAQVILERVRLHRNQGGPGLQVTLGAKAVARDCIATGNFVGFAVEDGGSHLTIERAVIAHANFFGYTGVMTSFGGAAVIGNSIISNVYTGLLNDIGAPGTLVRRGNNNFIGNNANTQGTIIKNTTMH
jgi:hypothetical protein